MTRSEGAVTRARVVPDGAAGTQVSYLDVLRVPGLLGCVTAATLARVAARTFTFLVVFLVLGWFGSASMAGWASLAALLPGLVTSPVSGAVLDRVGPARAIILDLATKPLLVAALFVADVAGHRTVWLVLGVAAMYSLASPLSSAGVRSLIPRFVPDFALARANALDSSSVALSDILGPALAGLGFGTIGGRATLLLIAALYGLSVTAMLPLLGRAGAGSGAGGGLASESFGGAAYVTRHPVLRGLALCYSFYGIGLGVLVVAIPVMLRRELGGTAGTDSLIGVLWAINGVAGALGAMAAGRVAATGEERPLVLRGALLGAAAPLAMAVIPGWATAAVGLAIVGFSGGLVNVGVLTFRQRRTDPDQLGRAFAISMSLNAAGVPLGSMLGGALADRSGVVTLAVASLAALCSAAVVKLLVPDQEWR